MKAILTIFAVLFSISSFAHGTGQCEKISETELQKIENFFDEPQALTDEEIVAERTKMENKEDGAYDFIVTGFGCDPDYAMDMAVHRSEHACWATGWVDWRETKRSTFRYVSSEDSTYANGIKVQFLIKCDSY